MRWDVTNCAFYGCEMNDKEIQTAVSKGQMSQEEAEHIAVRCMLTVSPIRGKLHRGPKPEKNIRDEHGFPENDSWCEDITFRRRMESHVAMCK